MTDAATTAVLTLEDGYDHLVSGNDTTTCGIRASTAGLPWQESTTNPCPVCYPDEKPKAKAKSGSKA